MEQKKAEPRPKVFIGNWKMNKTIVEARSFVSGLAVATSHNLAYIGLAVPFTMIGPSAEAARGTSIAIGAQNVSDMTEGAFTGEISCSLLKDAGASFVIVGHSERRQLFHEDDALINRKVMLALNSGLKVILCVGETLKQREAGKEREVLTEQLTRGLKGVRSDQMPQLMVAYEPVWAIGTGVTATPEIAQEAHAFCRKTVGTIVNADCAAHLAILYGGSVKVENTPQLLCQQDVDGFLIGGASLTLDSFTKIIQCQLICNSLG